MAQERTVSDVIDRDLARLAAATAAPEDDFATVRERLLGGGTPYRDARPGIEARRDHALDQRRLELALLPLQLQRVFVHRVARCFAGAAAILGGVALWLSVSDPILVQLISFVIPRMTLDMAVVGGVAGVLAAYLVGIFAGERIFERAARLSASAGPDVLADIHRHGPVAEARRLSARIDGFALSLPLLGIALSLPLLAAVLLLVAGGVRGAFEDLVYLTGDAGVLDRNAMFIGGAVAIAAITAILLGIGCSREVLGRRSRLARFLGHWSTLAWSTVLGVVVVIGSARTLLVFEAYGTAPPTIARWLLAIGGVAAIVAPLAWAALLLRRREQRLLHDLDTVADERERAPMLH